MLNSVIEVVKTVARDEIMPRYLKVARQRKSDGSMFTEADIASQNALTAALVKIADYPVLGEEMPFELQKELWQAGGEVCGVSTPSMAHPISSTACPTLRFQWR